ncbi:MAG: hypothetical protein A2Z49_03420 [Chloroflexi bacterium RBG_19FT_COMBO_56_12]|nr:MAG: hypothetical protein A2Z49_03420 [Chloroflexi bacterium RBG_19FT_COMBO_56_12]
MLVILRICVCSLAVYFLAGGLVQFSVVNNFWQCDTDTSVSNPADDDRPNDDIVLPGLKMMGNLGVLTALPAHSLHRLSRSLSPLLPPPQILKLV